MSAPVVHVTQTDVAVSTRGARPVRYYVSRETAQRALQIPGVLWTPGGVACGWDAAQAVAQEIGVTAPVLPATSTVFVGAREFLDLHLDRSARPYQPAMIDFLARRSGAICGDPMRVGKTFEALAAAVAIGADKVLVVPPALAKWVWAEQFARWLQQPALILEGRAATEARLTCPTCLTTGKTPGGAVCPACCTRNGRAYGFRPIHGREAVEQALRAARWVVVNYDLLIPQAAHDDSGKRLFRDDLPGWARTLAQQRFALCIADEFHLLRGRGNWRRKGESRRERFIQATEHIPRLWGLTGTPIFGYTRDLWGQLDVMSNGLWGRPHFAFDRRYCDGRMNPHGGWTADGIGPYLQELQTRLPAVLWKRDRADLIKDMPPLTRQIIPLEATVTRVEGRGEGAIAAALRRTAATKVPFVVESVLSEMAEGNKCVVLTYLRANAKEVIDQLTAGMRDRENAVRMRLVNPKVWMVDGGTSDKARTAQAAAFREWSGAAAFVATIDSIQVAISLKGATSVHFADLHHDPAALLQAEMRPYEPGITHGLSVLYYVVRDSIDEHVVSLVLPKMETLEKLATERGATDFRAAFTGAEDVNMADAIWDRLMQSMPVDGGAE